MSGENSSPARELPAHIRAQLNSAGRRTDTGGQPWEGRNLGEGTSHVHRFAGDDGTTPAPLRDALEEFARAEVSEEAVVEALREARLFSAVTAQVSHSEITEEGLVSDKEADMAVVSIQAPDGRKALPVFSRADALTDWHPEARPVAAEARKTALAAVEDGNQLLVLNPGTELAFVVRRPALWAIARGEPWTPSYSDPEVLAELQDCAAGDPSVVRVEMAPGQGVAVRDGSGRLLPGGGPGPELSVHLFLRPGLDQDQLDSVLGRFQEALRQRQTITDRVDSLELKIRPA